MSKSTKDKHWICIFYQRDQPVMCTFHHISTEEYEKMKIFRSFDIDLNLYIRFLAKRPNKFISITGLSYVQAGKEAFI